jgi:hypothetical protein
VTPDYHPLIAHCKRAEHDVYVGRGNDGRGMGAYPTGERGWLDNPHYYYESAETCQKCDESHGLGEAIELFEEEFYDRIDDDTEFRAAVVALEGKTLGCWFVPQHHCHGEVIAEFANDDENEDVVRCNN